MQTKICPKCGNKMIEWRRNRLLLNPLQYSFDWKCGCGYKEHGGRKQEKTKEDLFMELWKIENNLD